MGRNDVYKTGQRESEPDHFSYSPELLLHPQPTSLYYNITMSDYKGKNAIVTGGGKVGPSTRTDCGFPASQSGGSAPRTAH